MFLEFFQLREQPFGVTPDPAYLFPTRTHCEALDSLTEAIQGDRGFLALIAEPGMGKTTLLYQVLEGLRDSARAVFLFQTQCDSREFFQYLMSELGVDYTGMGIVAMHSKLNEILFEEMLAGRRFVLIVDEAQNLDDSVLETIRLLSNFETAHAKLLQIVLAGQPQLGEKLAQPHLTQLLQRIATVQRLETLTPEETAGYIEHRLRVAGYHGRSLFEPEALALIYERSRGIPRLINKICFRAMTEAYGCGQTTVSAELVELSDRQMAISAAASQALGKTVSVSSSIVFPVAASGESALGGQTRPAVQLTYQPPRPAINKPKWALWAVALAIALLFAGLALPRNHIKQTMQRMRGQAGTYDSLVEAEDNERTSLGSDSGKWRAAGESAVGAQPLPKVTAIQATSKMNDAQVVVLLDQPVEYESAWLAAPDRIFFDLYKTRLNVPAEQKIVPVGSGLLKSVRAAQNSGDVVRLVMEADGAKDYSAKLLTDPNRLVIDVHADAATMSNRSSDPQATDQNVAPTSGGVGVKPTNQLSLTRELGLKINRIVIDPGHGGYDTGTMGPRGLLEKNLCLDVALRLGRFIEKNIPGAEVVYTRMDDSHVPLETRTTMANDANADLFISIHANSSESREIRGVETYYVSLASSQEASDLAARENNSGQSSLHDLPDLIKKITNNEKTRESKQLAVDIQNALSQRLQLVSLEARNRGVKQAPFLVLTGANMPAVLSEISFVSNARDESLLLEGPQRERIAEGLYRGIAAYLNNLHNNLPKKQKFVSENRTSGPTGPGF